MGMKEWMLANMQIKFVCLMLANNTIPFTECVWGVFVSQTSPSYLLRSLLFGLYLAHFCPVNNFHIHHCPINLSHFLAPPPSSPFLSFPCLSLDAEMTHWPVKDSMPISLKYHTLHYSTRQLTQGDIAEIHTTIIIKKKKSDIKSLT